MAKKKTPAELAYEYHKYLGQPIIPEEDCLEGIRVYSLVMRAYGTLVDESTLVPGRYLINLEDGSAYHASRIFLRLPEKKD